MCNKPTSSSPISAGTTIRLGEQQLNDFSVGEAKIGEKQSRQLNSKYTIMQYVFLEKRYMRCTMESPPEAGKFSRIFSVKGNLTVCKITFNCKLQKKNWGDQDVLYLLPQ